MDIVIENLKRRIRDIESSNTDDVERLEEIRADEQKVLTRMMGRNRELFQIQDALRKIES